MDPYLLFCLTDCMRRTPPFLSPGAIGKCTNSFFTIFNAYLLVSVTTNTESMQIQITQPCHIRYRWQSPKSFHSCKTKTNFFSLFLVQKWQFAIISCQSQHNHAHTHWLPFNNKDEITNKLSAYNWFAYKLARECLSIPRAFVKNNG